MLKHFRILLCIVLVLSVLLSVSALGESFSLEDILALSGQGVPLEAQEIPLVAGDYSGFEIRFSADLADLLPSLASRGTVTGGDSSMLTCALSEEEARQELENAIVLSTGPDGAVFLTIDSAPCVLRGKTLTLLLPAADRGVPDTFGNLGRRISEKMMREPSFLQGSARWSPDGRYIFLNEPDLWLGSRLIQDDPFLLDTVTGEVFLLETCPKGSLAADGEPYRNVIGGRFSRDGRSFWYLLYADDRVSDTRGILMRWDLEAGTAETVFESTGRLYDLAEMGEDRWLLYEHGETPQLVRLSVSGAGTTAEREPVFARGALYPVSDDTALFLVDPVGAFSLLLPVHWNGSGPWLKIRSLASDEFYALTPDNAAWEYTAGIRFLREGGPVVISSSVPDFGHISALLPVGGTSLVLMNIQVKQTVTTNWPGRSLDEYAWILLDTETMKFRKIGQSFRGSSLDEVLYTNQFSFGWNDLLSFSPLGPDSDSAATLIPGTVLSSPDGMYSASVQAEDLRLAEENHLAYTNLEGTVSPSGNGYVIRSVFTRLPEPERRTYLIPEALTTERYETLRSGMSPANKKKIFTFYSAIGPDTLGERDDRDELLAAYPSLETETLYILKPGINKNTLEKLQQYFMDSGYTAEDFELDSAVVTRSRGTNAIEVQAAGPAEPVRNIEYVFPGALSDPAMTRTRAIQLAGLCDRINSAVYLRYLRPEEEPVPVQSLVPESCDPDGAVWHIALESAEDDGNTLTLVFIASPD